MVERARLGQSGEPETPGAEHGSPTPPVHLPSPSLWPAALALGASLLLFGVLTHWLFSLAGALLFVGALAKWIDQMRRESAAHPSEHDGHP